MSKNIKKKVIIFMSIILVLGAGFMYWGYTIVAHPTDLPICKKEPGTLFSISATVIREKNIFHRFYNIEPYRGPHCVDKANSDKQGSLQHEVDFWNKVNAE